MFLQLRDGDRVCIDTSIHIVYIVLFFCDYRFTVFAVAWWGPGSHRYQDTQGGGFGHQRRGMEQEKSCLEGSSLEGKKRRTVQIHQECILSVIGMCHWPVGLCWIYKFILPLAAQFNILFVQSMYVQNIVSSYFLLLRSRAAMVLQQLCCLSLFVAQQLL